jgi:hypothetical protein
MGGGGGGRGQLVCGLCGEVLQFFLNLFHSTPKVCLLYNPLTFNAPIFNVVLIYKIYFLKFFFQRYGRCKTGKIELFNKRSTHFLNNNEL